MRRAALTGEDLPVARVCDLPGIVHTLRGKVEFEVSEEGREIEVLSHLLRRATAETFRGTLGGADLVAAARQVRRGRPDRVGRDGRRHRAAAPHRPGRGARQDHVRIGMGEGDESPGHAAAALEFALEGLYLMRRLSKDDIAGAAVYRT